jgi:hypothetical protein
MESPGISCDSKDKLVLRIKQHHLAVGVETEIRRSSDTKAKVRIGCDRGGTYRHQVIYYVLDIYDLNSGCSTSLVIRTTSLIENAIETSLQFEQH